MCEDCKILNARYREAVRSYSNAALQLRGGVDNHRLIDVDRLRRSCAEAMQRLDAHMRECHSRPN